MPTATRDDAEPVIALKPVSGAAAAALAVIEVVA